MFDQRTADAEAECERLRGLLAIARRGLAVAAADIRESRTGVAFAAYAYGALRDSDPDATAETEQ